MSVFILLALDILLVVAALVAYFSCPRLGGELAKGLKRLRIGILVLGFAPLIETLLFALFDVDPMVNQIVPRLLIGVAYVFIILGFVMMRRAFEE
jgi:hypothetical protein